MRQLRDGCNDAANGSVGRPAQLVLRVFADHLRVTRWLRSLMLPFLPHVRGPRGRDKHAR